MYKKQRPTDKPLNEQESSEHWMHMHTRPIIPNH